MTSFLLTLFFVLSFPTFFFVRKEVDMVNKLGLAHWTKKAFVCDKERKAVLTMSVLHTRRVEMKDEMHYTTIESNLPPLDRRS